jgi:hypothetical protein
METPACRASALRTLLKERLIADSSLNAPSCSDCVPSPRIKQRRPASHLICSIRRESLVLGFQYWIRQTSTRLNYLVNLQARCDHRQRPYSARSARPFLATEDRSGGGVRDQTGLPRGVRGLATMRWSPRAGLVLRSTWEPMAPLPARSPSLAVPLPCHSQQSRPVPSGQPRTTPRRPGPAPFTVSAGNDPAQTGFASRGSWVRVPSSPPL